MDGSTARREAGTPPGPTFIGIGAQKSASTWLHSAIATNRDVFLPPVKELHYFDRIDPNIRHLRGQDVDPGARGVSVYKKSKGRFRRNLDRVAGYAARGEISNLLFYYRFLYGKRSMEWYAGLFPARYAVRGEITPKYALLSDEIIAKITAAFPDVKIIYLLRNPVDRAWSLYRYQFTRSGQALDLSRIDQVLNDEVVRAHSRYRENAARWQAQVKPGNLILGFYDAVVHQPQALCDDISAFLGCGAFEAPATRANVSLDSEMPDDFRTRAEAVFAGETAAMADLWGGYCTDWAEGTLVSDQARPATVRPQ
jgi:hypothetical protein